MAQETLAVIRQLDFQGMPVPIAPLGGAFQHVSGLSQAFSAAVQQSKGRYRLTQAQMPAVLGAAIMALEHCHV